MAAGHILRMTRDRPFVQLKIAVSSDGLIAPGDGAPSWVTGPQARQFAHILRARADAILVGRKTVTDDNPELTCRLPGLEARSPRRVILDAKFRTGPRRPHVRDRRARAGDDLRRYREYTTRAIPKASRCAACRQRPTAA